MTDVFVLLTMIFCHVVADYNLQGWLASAKTKDFWEKNAPDEMYKYDYLMALFMHSFAWTFLVMLPIALLLKVSWMFFALFPINILIHAVVDDLKANKKCINLIVDQVVHLAQILLTLIILTEV
jgi:hypothetical protein